MTRKITTYLIDDHNAVREAVAAMLDATQEITVVGHAADATDAISELKQNGAQVVLLDLKMEGMSGLAAIPKLLEACPYVNIIVFTMYDSPAYVWETINAGARGYLLKNVGKEELIRAIQVISRRLSPCLCSGDLQAKRERSTHAPLSRCGKHKRWSAWQKGCRTKRWPDVLKSAMRRSSLT
jgi:DNA-binding NarL/FixJ family response regulator